MSIPLALTAAAAAQGGVLTRTIALAHGITDKQLARWVSSGEARSLWRGILTLNPPPAERIERHRELAHAISVAYAGRLVVSHHSALIMAGLPTYDVDLDTVRLVRRNGGDALTVPGIKVSRCSLDLPITDVDGALVVQEAAAVAQVARECSIESAVVSADAALHRGSVTYEQLDDAVRLLERLRGSPRARHLLTLVDGRAESPGESLLRLIAVRAGIELEPQYVVLDRSGLFVARCDFRMVGTDVLVEFDGKLKYRDPKALFEEKLREDAMRRLSWWVERFVWASLSRPADIVHRLRAAADR